MSPVSPKGSSKPSALNIGKEAKRFDSSTGFHKPWKTIKKGDYLYARIPDHPNATSNGYVLEHRVVVENWIGRYLDKSEIVHHIDENKHNNELENLRLMSRGDHVLLHKKATKYKEYTCPNCGVNFIRRFVSTKTPKCSRKCNGEYSRKIQLGRLTKE